METKMQMMKNSQDTLKKWEDLFHQLLSFIIALEQLRQCDNVAGKYKKTYEIKLGIQTNGCSCVCTHIYIAYTQGRTTYFQ